MYITHHELVHLDLLVRKLQDIIEKQDSYQNQLFPEGIHNAREDANLAEEYIENVRNREVRRRAKQIVKKRLQNK